MHCFRSSILLNRISLTYWANDYAEIDGKAVVIGSENELKYDQGILCCS